VPTSVTQPTDSRALSAGCLGQRRDNSSVASYACRGRAMHKLTQAFENRHPAVGRSGGTRRKRGTEAVGMAHGEVLEFEEYVRTRQDALLRSARRLVPDPTDAQDLLQTALVRTYGRWDGIADKRLAD